ncbi:MAG: MFS transporter [Planctomycetota bacterium]
MRLRLPLRSDERRRFVIAFAWFFLVLGSYYMIRPVRETMATVVDRDQRKFLFTGTFVASLLLVPLFGWCATHLSRRRLVPVVYRGFTCWLAGFAIWFTLHDPEALTAGAFFVWVSVFNLFAVSVFWSVLADEFNDEQGKRLFGPLAAGGSLGGICGSLLITPVIERVGIGVALWIPFAGIELALVCHRLFERVSHSRGLRQLPASQQQEDNQASAGVIAGLVRCFTSPYLGAFCIFLILGKWCATAVYLLYVEAVNENLATLPERTALFAFENLLVQAGTLAFQLILTTQILRRLGMGFALAVVPLGLALGFCSIGAWYGLPILFWIQVSQRGLGYGLLAPTSNNLFTVVPRADKYQSKNAIDTVVFRGGDVASAWVHQGLSRWLSDPQIAFFMAPVALVWSMVGVSLGRQHRQKAARTSSPELAVS